jgi:hypothetical protein
MRAPRLPLPRRPASPRLHGPYHQRTRKKDGKPSPASSPATSPPSASRRGGGLVVAVPDGRRSQYELADERLAHALGDLLGVVLAIDPAACPRSEQGCC